MSDEAPLDTSSFISAEQGVEPATDPQPQPEADQEPQDDPGDADPEVNDEGAEQDGEDDQPPPRKKPGFQERIDELTRARRDAERREHERDREARYWRDVAEGRIKPQNGHDRQQDAPADAAPDPMDYDLGETDPAYIKDVIAHEVKRGVDEAAKNMAQAASVQAEERAWEAKQDAARSKFADYDQKVIEGADSWPCSPQMAVAIRTSDAGGEIAYHLASNPDEARRIATLDPISQIRALGRLEGQLTAQSEAPPSPKPKTATDAPRPPENQARGAGGRFSVSPDTDDFGAFERAFGDKFRA